MSTAVVTRRRSTWWTPSVRAGLFYGGCSLLLGLMMARQLATFLPGGVAAQLGHNSEAFLYAMAVSATIQVLRGRRRPTAATLTIVLAFAIACMGLAIALKQSDLPSSIATLNEPLVAVGLTALYVYLPRPVRWPLAWSAAVLAVIVVFFDTAVVLDQAESLVPLLIAPLALDVVDRSLLDPAQPDRAALRWCWCGVLVLVAVLALVLARAVRPDLSGPVDLGIDYAQRAAEAYWGWLLIHLYLGFWLPWTVRSSRAGRHAHGEVPADTSRTAVVSG